MIKKLSKKQLRKNRILKKLKTKEKHFCYYCGGTATYQLKNKKWCCHPFYQSCPVNREKRSKVIKDRWDRLKKDGYKTQFLLELKEDRDKYLSTVPTKSSEELSSLRIKFLEKPEECFCSFCGAPAHFLLNSGNFCCENSSNKCQAIRKKNSEGCLRYYDSLEELGKKRTHFDYQDLPEETKERMRIIKKGDDLFSNLIVAQGRLTRKKNFAEGKWKAWNKGVPETEEHKEAIRKGTIKYLKESGQVDLHAPKRISKRSISYIEKLNKEKGWNLQHGYSTGEYEVGGYFVDGYDPEKNIVFEYDEKQHYSDWEKNILREKDIKRQEFIIKRLGCEFYRYNEKKDFFYRVN